MNPAALTIILTVVVPSLMFLVGVLCGAFWASRRAERLESDLVSALEDISQRAVRLREREVRLLAQCDAVDRALGATIVRMDLVGEKETRH